MAESFGVEDRGHFYDPSARVRDVVVNHLMQVVGRRGDGAAVAGDANTLKNAIVSVFQAMPPPIPRTTCAGSTTATARSTASPDSTTETYAALRLDIENWRWSGVPVLHPHRQASAVTQTELRLVFKARRGCGSDARIQRLQSPNQLVVKLDPDTGIRLPWTRSEPRR
jgi:glucose-6-phosphate 1-dehydrogenase